MARGVRLVVVLVWLLALPGAARADLGGSWGGATGNPPSTPGWKFEKSPEYYKAPLRCPSPQFFAYCRLGIGLHVVAADDTRTGGVGLTLDFEKFVTDLLFNPVSFAIDFGESLGFNAAGGLMLDAWLGVGVGARVGPLALVPLFTVGVDTVGIDATDPITGAPLPEYRVPFAIYGAVGGRAILALRRIGLTAGVTRVVAEGDRAETRAKLDLLFLPAPNGMLSLSAYWTRYDDGKQAGIVIGFSFEK